MHYKGAGATTFRNYLSNRLRIKLIAYFLILITYYRTDLCAFTKSSMCSRAKVGLSTMFWTALKIATIALYLTA